MENNVMLNALKNQFYISFSMLEKMVEACPDELWNRKLSGFVFWQQLIHAFAGSCGWLREEKPESAPFSEFGEKRVYPEFERDPEIILPKIEVVKYINETRRIAEQWFAGKDDDWLKLPNKLISGITNMDMAVGQIRHLMYHTGHCDAILRDNGIQPAKYIDYCG